MNGYNEVLVKNYNTIRVKEQRFVVTIQFFRPDSNNSITNELLAEVMSVLNYIETGSEIKVVVFEGAPGCFCTGMDFLAIGGAISPQMDSGLFFTILKHLSLCSQIVISKVDGTANAGGIGFVAASDIVLASENATFGLSEALFGLLPACVLPFLMRRIGYQKSLWMSLVTQGISASRAYQIGLVDEVGSNSSEILRKNLIRLTKLETPTIKDLKLYMNDLWCIKEDVQALATNKISSLIKSPVVQTNISNYLNQGKLPWEK